MKTADLGITLDSHTVDTSHGVMAGFLVRDASSRRELGYIWTAGGAWRWKTPKGEHFGERANKRVACQTLRDVDDAAHGVDRSARAFVATPSDADILDAWRSVSRQTTTTTTTRTTTRDVVAPIVKAPARRVIWNDSAPAFDITSAFKSGLKGQQ